MAGSHSDSIIDSVEEFWNIKLDGLSDDKNVKLLTAGVNNMFSIATCAAELIKKEENHGLKTYLTYQRLVKALDFVYKGVQSLRNNLPKSDSSNQDTTPLSTSFERFEKVLDTLKSNLPQEDIVADTNKIPNSSPIELLVELFYKTIPEGLMNLDEFRLAFEDQFRKHFTETNSCGLPSVVFICFVPGGMIVTASAAKWILPDEGGKMFEYKKVNKKLQEMRKSRFRSAFMEMARAKYTKVKEAYHGWKNGGHTMHQELKAQGYEAFTPLETQGGAFRVQERAGRILTVYAPCIKCRHMYKFAYIGGEPTDDEDKDKTLFKFSTCAEDLCYNLLASNEKSDQKANTSLC